MDPILILDVSSFRVVFFIFFKGISCALITEHKTTISELEYYCKQP